MTRASAGIAALLLLPGCASFSAPTPGVLARVRYIDPPPGPAVRLKVRLDLESASMSGQFDGVLVARPGPNPSVRVQCFPDLGPKAVDLLATRTRVQGQIAPANDRVDLRLPHEGPPDPLLFMAVTLLEHFAPVTEARVEGMREEEGDLTWLSLTPVVEGTAVTVAIDSSNRIVRRRLAWGAHVRWEEVLVPGRSSALRAPGFRMSFEITEAQRLDSLPDSLFELKR